MRVITIRDNYDAPWPKPTEMKFPYRMQFGVEGEEWWIEFADSITYEKWLDAPYESIVWFHQSAMGEADHVVRIKSSYEN